MIGLIDFVNTLTGTLSALVWSVIVARSFQIMFSPADGQTRLVEQADNISSAEQKRAKLQTLFIVGGLLAGDFALSFRDIWARHAGEWDSTRPFAICCYCTKLFFALAFAREVSHKRCGEKAWLALLVIATVISFFIF